MHNGQTRPIPHKRGRRDQSYTCEMSPLPTKNAQTEKIISFLKKRKEKEKGWNSVIHPPDTDPIEDMR